MSYVSTYVYVHGWAETDVLATYEHPTMRGMPRHGDRCCVPGCRRQLNAGERAFAVIEVERGQRLIPERGEAWVGETHPTHHIWRDSSQEAP